MGLTKDPDAVFIVDFRSARQVQRKPSLVPSATAQGLSFAALTRRVDLVTIVGPYWTSTYYVLAESGGIRKTTCSKNVVLTVPLSASQFSFTSFKSM